MRPVDRPAGRVLRIAAGSLITALALVGCTPNDADVEVDLDQVREQLAAGADEIRESADEVGDAIAGANLDEQTRQLVDDAATNTRQAMEDARAAIDGAANDVGPEAEAALDDAARGLDDARRVVSDAAAETDGAVRAALDELADQIDRLLEQIRRT